MKLYLMNRICSPLGKLLIKIVYKPTFEGLENIPKDGPVILAGNHTHNFDCVMLFSSTRRIIHFMAKSTLFKGWKKHFLNSYGAIPVHRDRKDKACVDSAIEVLNNGGVIGIFPEGTHNKSKDIILPFKFGAVKMAKETGAKIVPFSITGKYKKGGNLKICFGKAYKVTGELEKDNEILMKKVTDLLIKNGVKK